MITSQQRRLPDWPERLHRMIESAAEVPFQFGSFDCCLHVCNCIRAILGGDDPAAEYRGKYSSEEEAAQIYGPSLEAFIAAKAADLGFVEVPATFASRGDLVFVDNDTSQGAIGVVSTDARFASCASDKGLAMVRMHRWRRAWKVGL